MAGCTAQPSPWGIASLLPPPGLKLRPLLLQARNPKAFLQTSGPTAPLAAAQLQAPGHRVDPQHTQEEDQASCKPSHHQDSAGLPVTEPRHRNPSGPSAAGPANPADGGLTGYQARLHTSTSQLSKPPQTVTKNILRVERHPQALGENRVPAIKAFPI